MPVPYRGWRIGAAMDTTGMVGGSQKHKDIPRTFGSGFSNSSFTFLSFSCLETNESTTVLLLFLSFSLNDSGSEPRPSSSSITNDAL